MVFPEVIALFTSSTHFYKNLMYERTVFRFDWHSDVTKKPRLRIADEHTYHHDLPGPEHLLHFGLTLEDLWTNEVISRLGPDLPPAGSLSFPCRKSDFSETLLGLATPNDIREIRLDRTQIQFVYGNRVESLALSELGSFQAKRGVLKFEQGDSSWFSRQGRFRIDYQHLGNAKAFLYYLSMAITSQ